MIVVYWIFEFLALAVLVAIPWAPVFWVLHLAKKHSQSRKQIALAFADRADFAPGGGPGSTQSASNDGWSDQHDDFEMFTDTDGGDGGGE